MILPTVAPRVERRRPLSWLTSSACIPSLSPAVCRHRYALLTRFAVPRRDAVRAWGRALVSDLQRRLQACRREEELPSKLLKRKEATVRPAGHSAHPPPHPKPLNLAEASERTACVRACARVWLWVWVCVYCVGNEQLRWLRQRSG